MKPCGSARGCDLLDAIGLEVFRHRLSATASEMSVALRRAAYSTNIKTRLDYSCAVFDADTRTVAQSFAQPIHLGTLAHFVPEILDTYGRHRLHPGDAIVCNDGHLGGLHLNDVCLVAPIYSHEELVGYAAALAHHVDVGGGTTGSIGLHREIFQEGLQIAPILLVNRGRVDEDVLSLITRNVRSPVETAGDFRAQVAATNLAQRRVAELVEGYGLGSYREAIEGVLDYTERLSRSAIRRTIPEGSFEAEDYLDDDGFSDEPIRIHVAIEHTDGIVHYDLTGCAAARQASVNTTRSVSFSACAYTLRALLGDVDIHMNDGFYRSIRLTTTPGSVVHAARPAAIGAGADTGARILETAFRAFATRLPERVPADSKGTMCNVSFGGVDPRTGESFAFYEAIAGGYGARAGLDGIDAVQPHMQNTENSPVEEMEASYPVSVLRYQLIPDSGGAGQYRGGTGLQRDYTFEGSVEFTVMADRAKFAPQGLEGGEPARASRFIVIRDGQGHRLPSKFTIDVAPGDVVSIQTGGGGGYGDASQRSPQAIVADIRNGLLSQDRARLVYGYEEPPGNARRSG